MTSKQYRIKFSRRMNNYNASYRYFDTEAEALSFAYKYAGDQNMFLETRNIINAWEYKTKIYFGKANGKL